MATTAFEDGDVGFEEAIAWLPSCVLDDQACDSTKVFMMRHHNCEQLQYRPKSAAEPPLLHSKPSSRPYQRPKHNNNWASGGHGMRAVFLDSSQKSGGTGVFLPQTAATHFKPSKKPACAPVLLPARVVQALNLNVHALGLQISPRLDSNKTNRKYNIDKDVAKQCCVISQNQNSSPELFLPKEWTY
ncbi:Phosphoglycerate mutase [Quillaja saponaria]|uniref:Phosphoglycerate mutase n=1 Tax=Quillaja saponaria TaxID=32244 RepID=A0AAD7KN58_QUISA|nr:Phosphoglycerate mutase [Quillaja saponaria]